MDLQPTLLASNPPITGPRLLAELKPVCAIPTNPPRSRGGEGGRNDEAVLRGVVHAPKAIV